MANEKLQNALSQLSANLAEKETNKKQDAQHQDIVAGLSKIADSFSNVQLIKGDKGDPGKDGQDGLSIKGDRGRDGEDGKDGSIIYAIKKTPRKTLGKDNDWAIAFNDSYLWNKKDGQWVKLFKLKGEKGDPGKDGENGEDGQDGLSIKGDKGDTVYIESSPIAKNGLMYGEGEPEDDAGDLEQYYLDLTSFSTYRKYDYGWVKVSKSQKQNTPIGLPANRINSISGDISIVAGSNVTVTNDISNKTITIASTGGSGGSSAWGSITGTLSSQTDLQTALNAKQNTITTGTTAQYLKGDLSLGTFPTNVSTFTNDSGYLTSNAVDSVNGQTGTVSLNADDIDDSATTNKFVTAADLTTLSNTSGTNTGDQTSIVGITGTKSQFDTACTDGNFLYVGDVTQYTDEMAQDAVGSILTDSSEIDFTYNDGAPSISASIVSGSIDESKLDVSVNASLSLANSSAQNTFKTISVSGQSDVVADSATDTLTLVAGTNVTITTNASTDTITINATGGSSGGLTRGQVMAANVMTSF